MIEISSKNVLILFFFGGMHIQNASAWLGTACLYATGE